MSVPRSTIACVTTLVNSATVRHLLAHAQHAHLGALLVIRGEPGVGKDTLARLIHDTSIRRPYPFVHVNCGAQPVDRCAADLFGHEKGVSSLATRRLLGGFECANRGTIYLNEIEALPRTLVPDVVRVLRTGKVSRIGGSETIDTDVRVIASTAQSAPLLGPGGFRERLRDLDVVELFVPPLRQRPEEIPAFASFFLERLSQQYRRNAQLCPEVIAAFRTQSWPGNIRELEETIRRLVVNGGATAPTY